MAKALTKVEIFYIENNLDKLNLQQIADDLGITLSRVRNFAEKYESKPVVEDVLAPKRSNLSRSLTRKTHGGKGSATIMTQAISEQLDEKRRTLAPKNDRYKNIIYRREE